MADDRQEANASINIGNLCNGALIKRFDAELPKVIANIVDADTKADGERSITLTVKFKPDANRLQIVCSVETKLKLVGATAATGSMYITKDDLGQPVPVANDPRQMVLFTPPKPKEAPLPISFPGGR